MNPLRPSPRLLRRLAELVAGTSDADVCAWLVALEQQPKASGWTKFPGVSIVKTYRSYGGRARLLRGYEVWRHLESSLDDPHRAKARLWFGNRRYGGRGRALQFARRAAAMLAQMSRMELHEWWAEYRAARTSGRPVGNLWRAEKRYEDRLDYADLSQLSHAYARR